MAYNKTNWQSLPSTDTPISTGNLNKIENGIYDNSLKADQVGDLTQLETTEKSTLVGAINENVDNISKIGKKLWQGSFSSGSITVEGISDYTLIAIKTEEGMIMLGTPNWGGGGFTNHASYAMDSRTYRFNYNSTNETLTIDNNNRGATNGAATLATIEIYGVF